MSNYTYGRSMNEIAWESSRKNRERRRLGDLREAAVGDFVLFGAHAGSAIKIGGVEYQLLRDDDVIGTLPEPS